MREGRRSDAWLLVPLAVTLAIAAVDAYFGEDAILVGLFVVGPIVAAALLGPRRTLLIGIVAVGLSLAAGHWNDFFLEKDHLLRVLVVAMGTALCLFIAELRERAEESERRARFLAEAGRLLGESLDYATTLRSVAGLAVPAIADWCAIDVVDDRGKFRHVAVAHADPEKVRWAEELRQRYPVDPASPQGAPQVIRTGEPQVYPEIPEELLRQAAEDEEHFELMRRLGMCSAMIVPMRARGRSFGAITLVATNESGRRFGDDDLEVAEQLAARSAVAVDNARLFGERTSIARALQDSLLPPLLPDIPGVEVAARFRPAGAGNEVGGDFYDLFDTGDSRWAMAMGDVCGKGAEAAAVTALARYTVRAAAMQRAEPSRVLEILNDALLRQRSDDRYCTVALATLEQEPYGASLTLASGGHPLPLLLRAGGTVEPVGEPGTVIGIVPGPQLSDQVIRMAPGDTLVLYTDGVLEAQAPQRILDVEELAVALGGCTGMDAASVAQAVERTALDGSSEPPRDDIAILVLRLRE